MTTISPILLEVIANRTRIVGITTAQYDFLIDSGRLAEDTSTELLDGFIVAKDRRVVPLADCNAALILTS